MDTVKLKLNFVLHYRVVVKKKKCPKDKKKCSRMYLAGTAALKLGLEDLLPPGYAGKS